MTVFKTAMERQRGRSWRRRALPLEAVAAGRAAAGAELVRRLFEPLGYAVEVEPIPLDESRVGRRALPRRCGSPATVRLADAADAPLRAAAGARRREALLGRRGRGREAACARGDGWLAAHPERELIARRYLKHERRLYDPLLAQLRRGCADARTPTRGGARGARLAARPAARDRAGGAAGLAAPGACSTSAAGRARCSSGSCATATTRSSASTSRRARSSMAARRLQLDAAAGRTRVGSLLQGPLTYRDQRLRGLRRGGAGRGHRAPRPAAAGGARGERVRLGAAGDGRRDDAERRVQPLWETLPAGAFRHRRPPLRVDARRVRGVGDRRRRAPRLRRALPAGRAGGRRGRRRRRRWRCSSDEDRALPEPCSRRARRRLRVGQVDVRGAALPADRGRSPPTSAAASSPTTRTTRARPTTRSPCCTRSPASGCARGRLTVVDATNVQREAREPLVAARPRARPVRRSRSCSTCPSEVCASATRRGRTATSARTSSAASASQLQAARCGICSARASAASFVLRSARGRRGRRVAR